MDDGRAAPCGREAPMKALDGKSLCPSGTWPQKHSRHLPVSMEPHGETEKGAGGETEGKEADGEGKKED